MFVRYALNGMLSLAAAAFLVGGLAIADDSKPTTQPSTQPYALDTCVVSGEKLGEMGDPYVVHYEGREVRLCCKSCEKKFLKDPATFLKKLDDAAKQPSTQP